MPRRALIAFLMVVVLWLSLPSAVFLPLHAAQPTGTPLFSRISIRGRIIAATDGLQLPIGAPITLHVLRATTPDASPTLIQQIQVPLAADGTFSFETLAFQPDDLVFASLRYEGAQQASVIVKLAEPLRDFELPITLYGRTTDPSQVQIVRAQHTFEFPTENVAQVLSVYVFRVVGDKFFATDALAPNGKPISVRLPLPIGAGAIAFDMTMDDALHIGGTDIAPEVQDTRPIFPAQTYEVIFSYQLPFSSGATIDQDYLYQTQQLEIRVAQGSNATLSSETHAFRQSTETVQGRAYLSYMLQKPLNAAERLIFTLSRPLPTPAPVQRATPPEDTSWFAVLVMAITIIGILGGAVSLLRNVFRQRR